jgi:predicted GTPase
VFDTKNFVLDFVIRKAGYYAIELYSGNLVLDESFVTRRSSSDAARAAGQAAVLDAEPLRILLIGQVNAGKSSAINALFGDVKTAVDVLPTTRDVTPFVFEREGLGQALIFDTAGYGEAASAKSPFAELEDELLNCDLVLLVCSALTAARQADRGVLEELRLRWQREPNRRPPPVIVILSHIDMLRPFAEWNPPYDLAEPTGAKAQRIAAATTVVAEELQVPPERVIPVCLLPERLYNVEEGLLPAIIECLPEGSRAKALRCLGAYRNEDYWRRLWRQAVSAGNVLVRGAAATIRR